ncbi:MAG: dihydroxyacetone kinase subunit DhaL [Bacillota bacterium]
MNRLSATNMKEMLIFVANAVIDAKEMLCQADRNIGDGDHGVGMANGFESARQELESKEFSDVYKVLATVGRTMIKVMGGASGIIFGLLFYAGTKDTVPKAEINTIEFSEIFAKALVEIQAKGQAKVGDKTIVDALVPMVESLKESAAKDVSFKEMLLKAYVAAEKGKEASKNYVARFGKAKTLGERAIGYPDAGAVSLTVIIKAMSDWASKNL